MKLVPRTEAQRQAALDQIYREVLHSQRKRKVPPTETHSICFISSVANLPSDEEVGQPIEDYNIYAELPDTIASDPDVINRINRAGEFFIQQNKCPPLNRSIRHFKQKIRSVEDFERLTDTIAATLKCIVLTSLGGLSQMLFTNTDDLKTMLLGTLNGLANSSSLSDRFEQEWHSPLVTPKNSVSWLKCKFSGEITTRQCCFARTKDVELSVEYYSFFFKSDVAFQYALKFAEHRAKNNLFSKQ